MWLGRGRGGRRPRARASGSSDHDLTTADVSLGKPRGRRGRSCCVVLLVSLARADARGRAGCRRSRPRDAIGPERRAAGRARADSRGRGRGGRGAVLAVAAVLARADRHRLARWHSFTTHPRDQQLRPRPAAVGRLREPLGVVEGGGRGVQRPAARGLGRGVVRGRAPALPPRHAVGDPAPQRAAPVPRRDGGRRRARSDSLGLGLLLAAAVAVRRRRSRIAAAARGGAARRRRRLRRARALRLGLGHPRP